MYRLYSLLLYLLLPWIAVRLLFRGLRNPAYWRRWPERFGYIKNLGLPRVIWIHAVSVGEVRAAVPLVRALFERFPDHHILITTMTPTGSDQVVQIFGEKVAHCYVPYDFSSAVNRFLERAKPETAIIMETELWPNIFRLCRRRSAPVFVTNVRMSEPSMRKYLLFSQLTRLTLRNVALFAAQSQSDAQRLLTLGAPSDAVHITGSIKFEIKLPASLRESSEVLRGSWGRDRSVWIAASTHEGEEGFVLAACRELKHRFPDHLLVLVPRHPERFSSVARLCRRAGFKVALRSEQYGMLDPACDILVGDTMGELQLLYGASDVAFIGGSLVPTGGHNLLEAAAVCTPVVFGPHMFNFEEISAMALEQGAGVRIQEPSQLSAAISDFMGNANRRFEAGEAGRKMVEENRGALEKNMHLIEGLMGRES